MKIAILIPSYRRPYILRTTLPTWLRGWRVCYLVVIADSPVDEEVDLYRRILEEMRLRSQKVEIIYELYKGRRGSVNARNRLLEIAYGLDADFAVMADDDYVLPNPNFLKIMARHLIKDKEIGAVGGRVIMVRRRRVDPDFFLNFPINIADPLTRLTGFILLDVVNGPRQAEFLTPFYMVRNDILKYVKYDHIFESPTAYREESDFQMKIRKLGYKLLFDPRPYIMHIGLEEGGNRPLIPIGQRIYWKARNHTIFIRKHFNSLIKLVWYMHSAMLLLILYRPWYIHKVFNGVRDGMKTLSQYSVNTYL